MSGRIFAKKVWYDGYCFDSEMEADYYKLLKAREEKGEIEFLVVHPTYVLQEQFTKNGKWFNGIYYEADFSFSEVMTQEEYMFFVKECQIYPLKNCRVIDIKGFATDEFLIKQKLFEKVYPEYTLEVLAKDIDGQFKPIEAVKQARKERKKIRKANKKSREWDEYDTLLAKPKRTEKQEARLTELATTYANKKRKRVKAK